MKISGLIKAKIAPQDGDLHNTTSFTGWCVGRIDGRREKASHSRRLSKDSGVGPLPEREEGKGNPKRGESMREPI